MFTSSDFEPPRKRLRKDGDIFLIGHSTHQILGAKLPSIKQVLAVFFYNLRSANLDVKESTMLVAQEVAVFYSKARIPIPTIHNCSLKVERLYNEWRDVQRNSSRRSSSQIEKEAAFTEKLDDLFDMAHQNALDMISEQNTCDFLIAQRQKGRVGCMIGTDQHTMQAEYRRELRIQQEEARRTKALDETLRNGKEIKYSLNKYYSFKYSYASVEINAKVICFSFCSVAIKFW